MNKSSNLLFSVTVITSLSGLLAVPAQAQLDLLRSFCNGYLQGAAITGNYSSIPDDCRQYMQQPSSSQLDNRNQELNSDSIMKSTREERYRLETKPERDRIMQRTYPAGNWY